MTSHNSEASTSAGPSTPTTSTNKPSRKDKKRQARENNGTPQPPSKVARMVSPPDDGDVDDGVIEDEDKAVDGTNGDSGVDPMEGLEQQLGPAGEKDNGTDGAMPVRADEFEQQAEREVEASKGLDGGAADEGKMKLVHQVSWGSFFSLSPQSQIATLMRPGYMLTQLQNRFDIK